jgi:hypothetical protein
MTPDQEHFLRRRFREASGKQPELKRLKTLLLRLGGEYLVAPPKPDADISALLEHGLVISGPLKLKAMKASSCHQNIAALWQSGRSALVAVSTGYALSDDGLWRQHSWGILREGILETTVPRLKYFGLVLQGERADLFASQNSRCLPQKPENPRS